MVEVPEKSGWHDLAIAGNGKDTIIRINRMPNFHNARSIKELYLADSEST